MNAEYLKKAIGVRVQLIPPALHLDAAGNSLPIRDEDWRIDDVTKTVRLLADSGHVAVLGLDHVQSFYTNPGRIGGGVEYGFLVLHMQVIVEGNVVRVRPNLRPGQPLDDREQKARIALALFAPEMARILAKQIHVLDRTVANFGQTSLKRPPIQGDSWSTLRPLSPSLYPSAPELRDLPPHASRMLVEFYDAVQGVADLIDDLERRWSPTEVNNWNVLMHKVRSTVDLGVRAIEIFSPGRRYASTIPAAGTFVERAAHSTRNMDATLKAHLARHGVK